MLSARTASAILNTNIPLNKIFTAFTQACSLHLSLRRSQDLESLNPVQDAGDSIMIRQRPLPVLTSRKVQFPDGYRDNKVVWLESLNTVEDEKIGLVDLHPDIFATFPRIDVIHQNITWQRMYRKIDYKKVATRAEMRGGGRKPWPQKGTGRARHGSIRSPIFKAGAPAHGPRGPKSWFFMLPITTRAFGLRVALSIKLAQGDLHIVDTLDIPSDDPQYMESLADARQWGLSTLFIDDTDIMPRNISLALNQLPSFNLMPVYGLNVYSMLKHDTLVLTLSAVEKIEDKLLRNMHISRVNKKYMTGWSPRSEDRDTTMLDDNILYKNVQD